MIPVPKDILHSLAKDFALDPADLTKIGGGREDSDGVVYATGKGPGDRALKIVAKNANEPSAMFKIMERARFFAYLGGHGVPVVTPMPNADGQLVTCRTAGKDAFFAYCCPFLPGETLQPGKWSDEIIESWGALIGQTHRLTQAYPVYDGITDPATGKKALNTQDEMEGFLNWGDDEEIKELWRNMQQQVNMLPMTRQTYGMVQNDPHHENILIHEGRLTLLDFDVANCHFFACDLAIAIQSVLFTLSGGMERPVQDADALHRFVTRLLKGYRREFDLQSGTIEQIELFIAYRRALLFTVMQDWLKTQPELYKTWKQRAIEQPPVLAGVVL